MKRLLLPLLTALALPTAVNANWFSGDIVVKNAIGEKTIVKKGTIYIDENTVNERQEMNKRILESTNGVINSKLSLINTWEENYAECLATKKRSYCDGYRELPKQIEEFKNDLEKYKLYKKGDVDKLLKYENWNGTGNEVVGITIYYTPIFEDLNKNKTVQKELNVYCWNTSDDFSSLGITGNWARSENEGLSNLEKKLCKKYAKF